MVPRVRIAVTTVDEAEIVAAFERLGMTGGVYDDPGAGVMVPAGSRVESKNSRCPKDPDVSIAPRELLRALDAAGLGPETESDCSSGDALSPGELLASFVVDCKRWGCVYRHAGRAEGKRPDCERPKLMRCVWCHKEQDARCGATRASKCEPCSTSHRKDVAYIGRSGASDSPTGFFFVTLTAPGIEVLPWDNVICGHEGGECSGELGCVVEQFAAAEWNYSMPQNWSWFVTYLRRELAKYGLSLEFFKTIETQERGVLHIHALVRLDGVMSRRRFAAMVKTCAIQWGFGRVLNVQHIDPLDGLTMARKAGYCASYVTKSADAPADSFVMTEGVDPDTGEGVVEPSHRGYRPWSASRAWGDSMRSIRSRRRDWAVRAGTGAPIEARHELDGAPDCAGGGAALDLKRGIYTSEADDGSVVVVGGGLSTV